MSGVWLRSYDHHGSTVYRDTDRCWGLPAVGLVELKVVFMSTVTCAPVVQRGVELNLT